MYGQVNEVTINDQTFQGIKVQIGHPKKVAVVRFPNAAELIALVDAQKIVTREAGRGRRTTNVADSTKAALKLFKSIRLDAGEAWDEFEANKVIGTLTSVEATDAQLSEDAGRITLETAFGETVHCLAMPTEEARFKYQRSARDTFNLDSGGTETVFHAQASVNLYDSLVKSVEGYIPGDATVVVPPNHKAAVVGRLLDELAKLDQVVVTDPNS